MSKLFVTIRLLFIISVGANAFLVSNQQIKVEIVSSDEIKQYPNAVPLERKLSPETAIKEVQDDAEQALVAPYVTFQYYAGSRIAGDYLLAYNTGNRNWGTPQNVQQTLDYPEYGTSGNIVTYASIVVQQRNYDGNAYIIWGGIGYRYIRIVVEANNTHIFNHDVYFYGV